MKAAAAPEQKLVLFDRLTPEQRAEADRVDTIDAILELLDSRIVARKLADEIKGRRQSAAWAAKSEGTTEGYDG